MIANVIVIIVSSLIVQIKMLDASALQTLPADNCNEVIMIVCLFRLLTSFTKQLLFLYCYLFDLDR